jgi:hypothetical protein
MSVQDDIGPSAVARWRVYRDARELQALAALACDLAADSPRADVRRALATLDRMRAILGVQAAQ